MVSVWLAGFGFGGEGGQPENYPRPDCMLLNRFRNTLSQLFFEKKKNLAPSQIPTNSSCTGTGISPLFFGQMRPEGFSPLSLILCSWLKSNRETPDQISRDFFPFFRRFFPVRVKHVPLSLDQKKEREKKMSFFIFAVLTR